MIRSRARADIFTCLALFGLLTGCASVFKTPLPVGTQLVPINSDNQEREYWLHVSRGSKQEASALVVVLHATGSNGEEMLALGDFVRHANENGYIVAAPNALGRAFNEGSGRSGTESKNVDDVAFIEQVISDIRGRINVSARRVFVTGFSSGGSMAQRFALESDMDIAAVASISGHLWVPERKPARPRPLLLIFGDQDPLNPVEGGPVHYSPDLVLNKPAPRHTARQWAQRLGCVTSVRTASDIVERQSWLGCNDEVQLLLLTVKDLGHFWPGGPVRSYENLDASDTGPYQDKMDATSVIWDFFQESSSSY